MAQNFHCSGDCGNDLSYVERADRIVSSLSRGTTAGRNFAADNCTHPVSAFVCTNGETELHSDLR
jgi:hypothetical protein